MTVATSIAPEPGLGVAGLEGMRPGPELAALVAGRNPATLSDDELIVVMQGYRRMASWAQAAELAAVAELATRRDADDAGDTDHGGTIDGYQVDAVVDEVALALTLTVASAGAWVELARDLTARLPATHRALADGRIDLTKARVISGGLTGLDGDLARRIEERVLAKAADQTTGRLRDRIRRLVRKADPHAAERRRRQAETGRRVGLSETAAGTSDLAGYDLPADAASAAYSKVNAIAAAIAADGDTRGIDQIRADVFVDLLRGRPLPDTAHTPTRRTAESPAGGTRPDTAGDTGTAAPTTPAGPADNAPNTDHAALAAAIATGTVADQIAQAIAETLANRLTDVHGLPNVAALRADPRGGAAVLVEEAARRMADAIADLKLRWCDAVTRPDDLAATHNDTGHGHAGYRPPAAIRRLVQHRDDRCVFPTCRRPAQQCDLDHTLAYHQGGTTCPCNLAPLCRRHHMVKQHRRWRMLQPWPGVTVWITPAGRWHIVRPDRE